MFFFFFKQKTAYEITEGDWSSDVCSSDLAVGGMVQKLSSNRDVVIVPQTSEQFESALRRYKQGADKSWSLTDCASFQVMEAEQIQAALTHDQHFAQAGFETLLR